MKSLSASSGVSFRGLLRQLITLVNYRIANGEFTERGLARMCGVSQPQIHHILKGKRNLSVDIADTLMFHLNVSMNSLVEAADTPIKKPQGRETSASGGISELLG